MGKIKEIKKIVLEEIKPSREEKEKLLNMFNEIKRVIESMGVKHIQRVELVGSVAKDTFLRGNRDLDIFVFFDESISKEELEQYGLEVGKRVFEYFKEGYVIKYAEHPYVKGKIKGFEVEIVPAYAIKEASQVRSAVDRTPFHKQYVVENLKNQDEVRILKYFLKNIGIYGSELYVRGFSGYACELFIIKYKTFENFLKEAKNFKPKQVVCIEDCNPAKRRFKDDVFILVDPVDSNRNVCSAVSLQSLSKLRFYADAFLSQPSLGFFNLLKKDFSDEMREDIRSKGKYWFVVAFQNATNEIKDTIYPQLEKFRRYVLAIYDNHDYKVERSFSFVDDDQYGMYFEFDFLEPSKKRCVNGPEVFASSKRVHGFVKKYSSFWIDEKGMLKALTPRDFAVPENLFKEFKTLSKEERHRRGVPKSIARDYDTLAILKDVKKIKSQDFFRRYTYDSTKIAYALKYQSPASS